MKIKHFFILIVTGLFLFLIWEDNFSDNNTLITSGIGYKNYQIGKTPIWEIIDDYGKSFETMQHPGLPTALTYKELGLSFFYYPEESYPIVGIAFSYPFSGVTDKGMVLNESKMSDLEMAYDTLNWTIEEPFFEWACGYSGILFSVPRDTMKPIFPIDEEYYKEMTISTIIISADYEDFENE